MKKFAAVVATGLALGFAASTAAYAEAPKCEVGKKIVFAGLDWDSNAFHTAVAQYVFKHGYGCEVDTIPGSTIPLHAGLARGDIQVMMEVWPGNSPPTWSKGLKDGSLQSLGVNFPDAVQAWYVPKYLVEGDNAPAKGLKSVADLAKFKSVFKDPEEPSKGRFYNCIAGWQCEITNTKKLHAYGLTKDFTNFRPGTGAALSAAVESAIKRKKPILFYYWAPTWLLGKVGKDVVQIQEPAYDEAKWKALQALKDPAKAKDATAYPVVKILKGARTDFLEKAPKLKAFLEKYHTTSALVSEALAYMQATGGKPADAAEHFLKTKKDLWTKWVPADVAKRVEDSLAKG
ncbi:MAG: ABC transporter substrate-binding protein [Hyphomicrobiaceae bacterium]